jgi:hypothetical protein
MRRLPIHLGFLALLTLAGCMPSTTDPVDSTPVSKPDARRVYPAPDTPTKAKVTGDTERDQAFARFLGEHSGGMIARASVGIEKLGLLRVVLDRSVRPEDTLELTKSIMTGARKEFPDRPINLAIFDPGEEPILKARYRPGQGVRYEIAHQKPGSVPPDVPEGAGDGPSTSKSGVTEQDRKFAAWAEDHGRRFLRYVEADLERNGRLWFGVTREVKPADLPELTKSLLEGARQEFPRKDLVATVFDPEGERIGMAHLEAGGKVRWEK